MSTLMESSLWAKQKQPVIQGFINEHRKLVSTAASRGFLLAPGFLYEFETGIEIDLKQKLSEVSYKILSEAVERDIKQAGFDADINYKNSAMAWELEKHGLLSAWDRALVDIKKARGLEDEELARLAIEASLQGIVLLNAKTAIEIEAEGLRAELAEIETGATDYEVQLAQQKLATATRKLVVIPILQQILAVEEDIILKEYSIIAKEGLIVGKEAEKAGYVSTLVDAESQVVEKKTNDLIPATQELLGVSQELAAALMTQLPFEIQILAQKVIDAGIQVQKAEKQVLVTASEIETATWRIALATAKMALGNAQRSYEFALANLANSYFSGMISLEEQAHNTVMNQERSTQSNVNNLKVETVDLKLAHDVSSAEKISEDSVDVTIGIAQIDADEKLTIADLQTISTITAKLTHIIG